MGIERVRLKHHTNAAFCWRSVIHPFLTDEQVAAGDRLKPAYYLLNSLYYYDIENNPESRYRDTDEAKEAVLRIYDMTYGEGTEYATLDDAYAAVTGYDVEEAKALFQAAAEKAIADGNYTAGQPINITCEATALQSLTTDYVNECQYLNEAIAAATETALSKKSTNSISRKGVKNNG